MNISKHLFLLTLLCLLVSTFTWAQTPPSNLNGASLRSWLKANFYDGKHNALGYSDARRKMYNHIDNKNNTIVGVYSGYVKSWNAGGTGNNPDPINCEHTVPQSFFGKSEPMRSDIHHLFPTYKNWNSVRSNYPFAEINDNTTTKWMRNTSSRSSIPSSNIDEYSEQAGQKFEPREDHKGNVARAVFYFFTMYPTQAGSITSVGNLNTLYQWHLSDPVDAAELARNNAIEQYQGDRNPYVDQPNLVARAWGFSIGGSCGTPTALRANNITTSGATLSWAAVSGANKYDLQYRTQGASSWTTLTSLSGTSRSVSSLASGTAYEFRVRAKCTTTGAYSGTKAFTTTSGGSTPVAYCASKGNSVSDEWIGEVQLGTINKSSGANGGYADFTATSTDLSRGQSVAITITPAWSGTQYNEGYAVFIDFNQDGDFNDSGETVWTRSPSKNVATGSINIPASATLGTTRMRVSMKYKGVPTSCEAFSWGEVEDYTVNITSGSSGGNNGGGNATDLFISEYIEGSSFNKGIEIANFTGTSVNLSNYSLRKQTNGSGSWSTLNLSGTLANGQVYVIVNNSATSAMKNAADLSTTNQVLSFNGNDPVALFKGSTLIDIVGTYNGGRSNFAKNTTLVRKTSVTEPNATYTTSEWTQYGSDTFTYFGQASASRTTRTKVEIKGTMAVKVYPVPAQRVLNITTQDGAAAVWVTNLQGQSIYHTTGDQKTTQINVQNWAKGIYLLNIKQGNIITTKRIVVR